MASVGKKREVKTLVKKEFEDDSPKTINMLLDITNFFGEGEKRLGPTLIFLCLAGAPVIIYIYFLYEVVEMSWLVAPYIIYVIWVALITIGEQKKRLIVFRKKIHDVYSSSYKLMNIKPIHDDGVLEYNNRLVAVGVLLENGTDMNMITKSSMVSAILEKLAVVDHMDVYTQNINEIEALQDRYERVNTIKSPDIAKDYVSTIDSYIKKATHESLVTRTIIMIKGPMYKIEEMEDAVDEVLGSQFAKVFKVFRRVTKDDLENIIRRDVSTYINFEEMLMKRFANSNYMGSKVLDYNVADRLDERSLKTRKEVFIDTRGFMVDSEEEVEVEYE